MATAFSRSAAMGVIAALVLTGCGLPQRFGFINVEPEVVLPFNSDLTKGDSNERRFTVTVEANGADIDAVRESVRHPATGYCLLSFGGSDIAWDRDASGDWAALRNEDGDLRFAGTCTAR